MKKVKSYLLWGIKIILALFFILASSGKLTQNEGVIQMFQDWGYFDGFYLLIGGLEFVLAILLLIPKTAYYAAIGLFIIMIGALLTHLFNDPILQILRPSIFMIGLGVIVYWSRPEKQKA